ncbi:MAG: hypothetical protein E5W31_01970, partial [Mesorhizobium sp.]
MIPCVDKDVEIAHRLGQFLDEQRNTLARNGLGHCGRLNRIEPFEHDTVNVCAAPGRLELRPKSDEQQHGQLGDPIVDPIDQFQRRRVEPLCI